MAPNTLTNSLDFLKGNDVTDSIPFGKPAYTKTKIDPSTWRWSIPDDETLQKCLAHAKRMQENHPTWNPEKVARKVAEHFNLKPEAAEAL
jgi:hypothetical protein